ncbi:hypothetical protein B0T16DRAFT_403071 [Cercophora newfieldiana]|uniref:Transcription factor domain-containing protein n=1 Tax=Cercophora newfieldiana TaxID=92897 RepID=A0AA39YHD3_9PEZI|nr:hypothetical protein B0T16DRAFT_403071 [Cercophora newfieldiana]
MRQEFPAWTCVTPDTQLIRRLISRAFALDSFCAPSLISRPQFWKDVYQGGRRYCSEALVNSLLGWSCKMLDVSSQLISQVSFGDAFLGEAKMLLAAEGTHVNIPSIQALGVLAWIEICQGNGEEACVLAQESVRSSIYLGLQNYPDPIDEDFRDARALAYCGGFTLMRMLRLLTGRLEPKTGPLFMRLELGSEDGGQDTPEVRVERGISLQMRFFSEVQFCAPVSRFTFEVTETVHTFLSYNLSGAMTAADLEEAYAKCIGYYTRFTKESVRDIPNTPDLLFAHIWYQYCLLSLLRPFVRSNASLAGGGVPQLLHGATPTVVCQQSSEAVIFLTSTYQTRYSLKHPPPLLPHVVFAATLYQLSLLISPHCVYSDPSAFVGTPSQPPSRPNLESPRYSLSMSRPHHLIAEQQQERPPPLSPTLTMQAQREARRRASGMSSTSLCLSVGSEHAQPSLSRFASSTTSDMGEGSSSEASFDILPAFTSAPIDLVTVSSLQLASMAAQHAGAASAVRMLHSLGSVENLAGSNIDLAMWARSLPFQLDGFMAATLWTALGGERDPIDSSEGVVGLGISGQPQVPDFIGTDESYQRVEVPPLGDGVRPRTPVCG